MINYDPLNAGWRIKCPLLEENTIIGLSDFRTLARLPGPLTPAVHNVQYLCPQCGEDHHSLFTERELDFAPIADPLLPELDLISGQVEWHPDLIREKVIRSLLNSRWPFYFCCQHERRQIAAWPSALRAVEPHGRDYLVGYVCPSCEKRGYEKMPEDRLILTTLI